MTRTTAPVILGGRLRGLRLVVPPGLDTRPTRAAVREAVFGMLGEALEGARVLDLYAGSGAFGLEALSRGAAHVTFVEQAPRALAALRANLAASHAEPGEFSLLAADCQRFVPPEGQSWDLVLADPPYALRDPLPAAVCGPPALAAHGRLLVECSSARIAPVAL
ncbi:MAG TPA: RsmD family RNA methyltransferase, partial [Planctomycetota bacterium]|nr:RsmD family RNA methyltransferase [Planctomycetota bacterium]